MRFGYTDHEGYRVPAVVPILGYIALVMVVGGIASVFAAALIEFAAMTRGNLFFGGVALVLGGCAVLVICAIILSIVNRKWEPPQ